MEEIALKVQIAVQKSGWPAFQVIPFSETLP